MDGVERKGESINGPGLPRKAWAVAFIVTLAFATGAAVGRTVRFPLRGSLAPCLEEVAEDLEDAEKGTMAVVRILDDMAQGRASSDSSSLTILRDSMQELGAALGNLRSQVHALQRRGELPPCGPRR